MYTNIISINDHVFFTDTKHIFTPVYTFISLANLDLGIQTCFYNGMDDYAKMWLQLAFPFYLIFIATLLIITSRYSITVQRITARRVLPVLATLFLLPYTKILRTVSSVLFSYSTIIHLPSKYTTLVWSADANVPSLSMLVLNSRDWQGNVWLLEKMRLWITNIIKIRTQKPTTMLVMPLRTLYLCSNKPNSKFAL